MLLHVRNTFFYFMTMVNVDVSEVRALPLSSFINLNNGVEEFLNASSCLEDCGYHGHAEEF